MTLMIGKDRDGQTHYVRDDAAVKGCGKQMAMCGMEVLAEQAVGETSTDCFYCHHAYDLNVHLLGEKKPAPSS